MFTNFENLRSKTWIHLKTQTFSCVFFSPSSFCILSYEKKNFQSRGTPVADFPSSLGLVPLGWLGEKSKMSARWVLFTVRLYLLLSGCTDLVRESTMASPPSRLLYSCPDEAQGAAALITVEHKILKNTQESCLKLLHWILIEPGSMFFLTETKPCSFAIVCLLR